MINDLQHKNGGFTYIEVLVGLVIIALVITPMSYSFLIAVKMNRAAEEMGHATTYAEQLLEDVKYQMTQDIELQQKILGGRYKTEGKSETEIKKAKEGVSQYLVDENTLSKDIVDRGSVYLDIFLASIGETDLVERYEMDKYAYEIALWRMSDISFINNTLTWDKNTLKKATKIYSDRESSYLYQSNGEVIEDRESAITFQITPEMLRIFQDETLSYVPNQVTDEKILDNNSIQFDRTGIPEVIHHPSKEAPIKIQHNDILDSNGMKIGYVFHIYEGIINKAEFPKDESKYRSMIEVDVRNLLRKSEDLSEMTTYDQFTFKFINHTAYDQFIHIRKNLIETENQEVVNQKFNIILEDKKNGKSLMTQTNDIKPYENYLIAIVVRDKHPVQGQVGKVVKKMINVYSYNVNRRK